MAASNLLSLRMRFFPVAPLHRGNKSLFVFLQFTDKRLILRFLVSGGPENHFGEDGSKVDALVSQHINELSSVGGILFGGDDFVGFEAA